MAEYEIFKSFYSEEEAVDMCQLLLEKGIDARLEKTRTVIDKLIIGEGLDPTIHLKIQPQDFIKAHQVIDEHILSHLANMDPDYYLFSFSNQELLDIIKRPDEWNNQDVIIAKKLLADRNQPVSDQQINVLKEKRITELKQPEKGWPSWLIAGYVIALFFGFAGLLFGLFMMNVKKVLPDGSKVLIYDKRIRIHCIIIVIISALTSLAVLLGWIGAPWQLFSAPL